MAGGAGMNPAASWYHGMSRWQSEWEHTLDHRGSPAQNHHPLLNPDVLVRESHHPIFFFFLPQSSKLLKDLLCKNLWVIPSGFETG